MPAGSAAIYARPFNRKFTAVGLTALLRRLSEREQQARQLSRSGHGRL